VSAIPPFAAAGAIAFYAVWVLVGLTVFVIALSGGPRRTRESVLHAQGRRGRRVAGAVIALLFVVFGGIVPALVIAGNHHENRTDAGVRLTASEQRGRKLFGHTCNQCHTLREADTVGRVGPNLDDLKPPEALVLNAIELGRARGNGRMPRGLLRGRDAKDVASFVSAVAGRRP
jgi:mono/diheme cytochrome c family protein